MFTDSFLEFLRSLLGHQLAVPLERQHQAAPQRIEYQAVGNRVNEPAGYGADTRERLQAVPGNGQRQRQSFADPALAEVEKFLDIEIPRRCTV